MRVYILWFAVIFFSFYSWKDWYKSLCFLILLMAIVERPDMPKVVLGIPGLNPWNLLFVNVLGSAIIQINKDANIPKLPKNLLYLTVFYFLFIPFAYSREIFDVGGLLEYAHYYHRQPLSKVGLTIEDLINPIKYAIPGILFYLGCNNSQRLKLAIVSLLVMYFLIALQIIKVMPLGYLTDGTALEQRAIRVIDRDIGYYRSDASIFLAGAAWAMYAFSQYMNSRIIKIVIFSAFALTTLAIALTGGRIGQGAFLGIGLFFAWYKWKRLFFIAPIGILILVIAIPSIQERFTQGFTYNPDDPHFQRADSIEAGELNSITSGRTIIWPHVIDKIFDAPFLGYGRRAMQRTGLSLFLGEEYKEPFPHPHNAYLQLFLDNGFLISIPILLFYYSTFRMSFRLFKEKDNNLHFVTGALGVASILSFLLGGIGQQSFYPVASSLGLFCAIGLAVRIYNEKYILVSLKQPNTANKTGPDTNRINNNDNATDIAAHKPKYY